MEGCSDLVKEAYASVDTLKGANIELEGVLAETRQALETVNLQKEEAAKKAEKDMMDKEEEMKKMKAELEVANETIAGYKMKEEEMAKKEKKMKRMAALIEAGVESESADATAEQFNELNDELFATMTSLLAAKKSSMKEEMMMKKNPKASENTDTSVLEEVEVAETEVELGVGGEQESAVDNTRAELVEFVCARLGKKLNKGE
jgi:hypothetical protein